MKTDTKQGRKKYTKGKKKFYDSNIYYIEEQNCCYVGVYYIIIEDAVNR